MVLIINADDFGYSQSVNRAIADCFEQGLINRTTIMVNMPYAESAAETAAEKGFFDAVGLHINLTEGKALSKECACSELCDENGFFRGVFHVPIKSRIYLKKKLRNVIYAEVEAQIKRYIEMGFPLMHADSHNYTHVYFSIYSPIRKLLEKYGFKSVRISRNIPENDFSLPFKIYKSIFNFCIKRLKISGRTVETTEFFGSVQDLESLNEKKRYVSDIELMTHPDYIDGVLTDNTLPKPHPFRDKKWLTENGLQLHDVSGKKKRILVCFIQAHIGGAMTALVNFLNALDTEKYDVDVLFYEKGDSRYGIKEGINILPQGKAHSSSDVKNIVKKGLSPAYVLAKFKEIYFKKIKHNNTRAVQIMSKQGCRYSPRVTQQYDAAIAFESSWALNYCITKVSAEKKILWFHNDFENAGLSFKTDRRAFENADALVFVSENCRLKFINNHPEFKQKAYFVPNLLSCEYLRVKGGEGAELPFDDKESLKLLSVARISFAEKGFDRAIRVFSRLKTEGGLSGVKWIIVGDGPDMQSLEAMIKDNQLENVIYLIGLKENPIPYMKSCDILFLPSLHEGKPMVVTEGFIMGLVPVVTEYTSASEQIREGFDGIVLKNSEEGLYNGLKELFYDKSVITQLKEHVENTDYGNEAEIAVFDDMMEKIFL